MTVDTRRNKDITICHRELIFVSFWDTERETMTSIYWVPFCLYMELTVAPLVASTSNNTNPVLFKVTVANICTAMYGPLK